jgi:hypothetical protein
MTATPSRSAPVESVRALIAGRWEVTDSPRSGSVSNPSTGRVIAQVPFGTAADVGRAVVRYLSASFSRGSPSTSGRYSARVPLRPPHVVNRWPSIFGEACF